MSAIAPSAAEVKITDEIAKIERDIKAAWGSYEVEVKKQHAAWAKVEKSAKKTGKLDDANPTILDEARATDVRVEKAHKLIQKCEANLLAANRQLKKVNDPVEIERRMMTTARLTTLKRQINRKTARDQGFPEVYLGETGNFKPGLDATAKSDLTHAYLGLVRPNALATFTPEEAMKLLQARGWMGYVEQKQKSLEAKEAKEAVKTTVAPKAAAKPRASATRKPRKLRASAKQ